jgi:hypothetical protein
MADLDDFFQPEDAEAVDEPEAVEAEPEAAVESGADDEAAAVEERLYAGKYKGVDEMEKAYLEAQRLISQGAHKQPPEPVYQEEEPADAPLDIPLPLGGEPLTRNELEEWATENPRDAALWAMQRDGLHPDLKKAVIGHWARSDPDDYIEWKAEQREAQMMERLQGMLAPQMQFVQQQQQTAFLNTLQTKVEGWNEIGRDVLAAIQQNPQGIPPQVWAGGMDAVAAFIDQWYGNAVRYERYRQAQSQQPPVEVSAPVTPRGARAASENSSGPAAPAGNGQPSEDDVRASIMAAVREQVGSHR